MIKLKQTIFSEKDHKDHSSQKEKILVVQQVVKLLSKNIFSYTEI